MSFVTLAAAGFAAGVAPASTGFSWTGSGLAWLALGVAEGAAEPGVVVAKPPGAREDAPPLEYRPVASSPDLAHEPNVPVTTPAVSPASTTSATRATSTRLRRN
jgi:hypothetical protein